ncbi:hypothetical protein PCC9214_02012 [Planktothrix tepida]|uniref:Uncharacterized protein n=2 Tax=Planktothrix TaxID=54304 RepID=A0A1J1LLZ0_9CYAN|nr:hypothetical protein PCC9214_02012 [Planktothrix tepida]CAD5969050.1 hypothetical protein NO713_03696 [Planktothrix pseudagardhii]CUR33026.1 hypothetical protein PL9214500273 [Planktothrix tepida PCC 9214]
MREPQVWRGGISKEEKDLVYIPNQFYSILVGLIIQIGKHNYHKQVKPQV